MARTNKTSDGDRDRFGGDDMTAYNSNMGGGAMDGGAVDDGDVAKEVGQNVSDAVDVDEESQTQNDERVSVVMYPDDFKQFQMWCALQTQNIPFQISETCIDEEIATSSASLLPGHGCRKAAFDDIDHLQKFGSAASPEDIRRVAQLLDLSPEDFATSITTPMTQTLTQALALKSREHEDLERRYKMQIDSELICLDIMSNIADIVTVRKKGPGKRRPKGDPFETREEFRFLGGGKNGDAFQVVDQANGKRVALKAIPFAGLSKEEVLEKMEDGIKEVRMQKKASLVCPDGVVSCQVAFTHHLPPGATTVAPEDEPIEKPLSELCIDVPTKTSSASSPQSKLHVDTTASSPEAKAPAQTKSPSSSSVSFSDENAPFRSMVILSMEAGDGNFGDYIIEMAKDYGEDESVAMKYYRDTLSRFRLICCNAQKLHSGDLEHMDLHSRNVLVCQDPNMGNAPRIGDFGQARTREEAETFENTVFGTNDVWLLAGILLEIFNEVLSDDDAEYDKWLQCLSKENKLATDLLKRLESQDFPSVTIHGLRRLAECIEPMKVATEVGVLDRCIEAIDVALQSLESA